MSAVDDILADLPVDDLAQQLGTDPASLQSAAAAALPALLGGLEANAQDPAGAASLAEALGQHDGPVDALNVDAADGAKIVQHIFGGNQDQVVSQLGALDGHPNDLVKKVIPLLAPLVLAYLAKQVGGKGGAVGGALGGGILGTVLGEVLKGAGQGSATSGGKSAGSIISDVLGGLLGGGRK
ncbi:DUF937 domain-containing protein [Nocardioides marmoriginsengisoli]|uniref:DUF937 domain-containing protein n=1 Tax=Nocardioides marmoriginsengisoli TaxID=661483 RepID=A0A3N0CIL6_9ACTN|nr:DUF937 domain-containing protein [Nocardioides marmoriginsengisoli]RNL63284.1 DUF937 domain-containing protein [Nocardioides marmoriginsengisoli]